MDSRLPVFVLLLCTGGLSACSSYEPFDSNADLRGRIVERLGAERAAAVRVPFELSPELETFLDQHLKPAPGQVDRVRDVLDFIFEKVGLRYELFPTRDAMGAYRARSANCLSFVNLFIGIARHQRLSPFYVEVADYQRWTYRDGLVVSQGHIVAGLQMADGLKTYDFLPYHPKAYRNFRPIDDVTAAAHYYNNLGAESLLAGDLEQARRDLEIAADLAPRFVKALNNLGVLQARTGDPQAAAATYRRGLEVEPQNLALLENLAELEERLGQREEAERLFVQIEGLNSANPFFYLLLGERALAGGDSAKAMHYMTEALRRDTESPEVHLGLLKVYIALGDLEKARHHLTRALQLDATNQEARRYVEMLGLERR